MSYHIVGNACQKLLFYYNLTTELKIKKLTDKFVYNVKIWLKMCISAKCDINIIIQLTSAKKFTKELF